MLQLETALSRRGFLKGGVGLGALMLPQLAAGGTENPRRRARSVIFLLLEGGMSHLETWDLKPNAPKEIRGEFRSIATAVPGLSIGEHMPRLAEQAQRYSIVRSVHSAARNHSPGLHWILTGHDNPRAGVSGERVNRKPSVGSIVAHELGSATEHGVPNFVAIPNRSQLGGRTAFAGAADLGAQYEAFESGAVPASATAPYEIPSGLTLPRDVALARLEDRRRLLETFDGLRRTRERAAARHPFADYQDKAFDLLLGSRGREAFDIGREPEAIRRMYGDSETGQGTLLARRLVEAGVDFVLVNYSKNNSWDHHSGIFGRLKKMLPPMERAVAALLTDLDERGLLDDTLVVLMGEMGRTPVLNDRGGAGRDHWPDVYSIMLAGGGIARGQVLGSSTRGGEQPADRPVHVHEVIATIYRQLGIDPHLKLPDRQNRPVGILPDAEPIHELLV